MAVDKETNRVLYAISLNGSNSITFSSSSTAEAYVFLCPILATADPLLAGPTLEMIRTNSHVQELAALINQFFAQSADPFTNTAFLAKYAVAVRSVAGQPAMVALAQAAAGGGTEAEARHRNITTQSFEITNSTDYPLDFEYTLLLTDENGKSFGPYARKTAPGLGPRLPRLNPVDWLVVIQQIDADAAFPEGEIDFRKAWQEKCRLELFPLKPGFLKEASVEPNLNTERFNPVKFGMKRTGERCLIVAGRQPTIQQSCTGRSAVLAHFRLRGYLNFSKSCLR